MKTLFLLLLLLILPAFVNAHEMRPAIATATITPGGSFDVVISLNLEAAMAGIEPQHSDTSDSPQSKRYEDLRALTPAQLQVEFDSFGPRFAQAVGLFPHDRDAELLSVAGMVIPPVGNLTEARISEVTLAGVLPAETDQVIWSFDPSFGDSVIRLRAAGTEKPFFSQYVSGAKSAAISLDVDLERSAASVFSEYLQLGFVHIIPKGFDHILFIVGLFLLSTRRSVLFWQITAFTAAHTLTLALGSLGIVRISPAIVEPLIALSIVYVAVENLMTTRMTAWRPLIIFGFGLLHGLGFADILTQFELSTAGFVTGLIAFNVGVELGQLTVIALCFILVGWTMKMPNYQIFIVRPASLAIASIASFWVIERVFA
jgi:hypothetical protein